MDDREILPTPVRTGAQQYPHDVADHLKAAGVKVIEISASKIAQDLGNIRAQNICLLGALVRLLQLEKTDWKALIKEYAPVKALAINLQAFDAGYALSF
jgi:indolepyruvate ferredoxin oxidoreductase beta subunit